ncbi:MAG: dioxygenase [Rubrivivax sp. SCN 71-131]|jgi:aromatic ring-opening dioxygenase catalytic subunit (LigB family)|nr:MAG: dioxygenase [Rubrivivax sp. SCN 71-131]
MTPTPLPTYFISHGGGPWPWMKHEMSGQYDRLEAALRDMPHQLGAAPRAVLMLSAHWEERDFTVMTHPSPPMIYDYGGFPDYTYRIRYPAPGAPQVAQRVVALLEAAGIGVAVDAQRGFDHGLYAPMAVMYPGADMPVLQLSLRRGLDPREHLALGRALAPLRGEGILIVGSGLSFHNLGMFGPAAKGPSAAFDDWLQRTLAADDPNARTAALADWERAPAARQAHPREEHLLPLMVAVGAAEQDVATRVYHEQDFFGGISVSSYRFGGG